MHNKNALKFCCTIYTGLILYLLFTGIAHEALGLHVGHTEGARTVVRLRKSLGSLLGGGLGKEGADDWFSAVEEYEETGERAALGWRQLHVGMLLFG